MMEVPPLLKPFLYTSPFVIPATTPINIEISNISVVSTGTIWGQLLVKLTKNGYVNVAITAPLVCSTPSRKKLRINNIVDIIKMTVDGFHSNKYSVMMAIPLVPPVTSWVFI